MKEPVTSKDIQSLTGKMAALTRFISSKHLREVRSTLHGLMNVLRHSRTSKTKAHLLSKPEVGDTLIIYLSVSASIVSFVLIRNDGNVERPVYHASKALQDTETRYSNIEKLALALVMSARKRRPYFQAYSIIVLTNHPLRQILQSPDTSG
ncbi:hypothetical protein ACFX1Q_014156 [Malus domestica]